MTYPYMVIAMRTMSKKPDSYLKPRGENKYFSIQVAIPKELREYYLTEAGKQRDKIVEALGTNNILKARMLRDKRVSEIFFDFEALKNGDEAATPTMLNELKEELAKLKEAQANDDGRAIKQAQANLEALDDHFNLEPSKHLTKSNTNEIMDARYQAVGTTSITYITEEYLKHHPEFSLSTHQKMRRYAKELVAFMRRDGSPKQVTFDHALDFTSELNLQEDRKAKAKKDILSGLSRLWIWSRKRKYVSDNVFEDMRDEIHTSTRGTANDRYPFSNADILDVVEGIHKIDKHKRLLSILTIMGLYTGIREAEITGLRVEHILDGHVLDIVGGKNVDAVRKIPTHSSLHPLIDMLVENSLDGYLVPDIPNRKTPRETYASAKYSAFKQELWGHNERPKLTFHSFRHTIEDRFREAEVYPATARKLTGRKDKGSEGVYGKGISIAKMQIALESLGYDPNVSEAVQSLFDSINWD